MNKSVTSNDVIIVVPALAVLAGIGWGLGRRQQWSAGFQQREGPYH